MRLPVLAAAGAALLATSLATVPASAQEDPNLPGVDVTIRRGPSFLDPGPVSRGQSAIEMSFSPLYSAVNSVNYHGVVGFSRPDPYLVPGARPWVVDYRAPDFLMR